MMSYIADGFILIGLALLGVGLFLWVGLPITLTIVGVVVLIMGVAGNIAQPPKKPKE